MHRMWSLVAMVLVLGGCRENPSPSEPAPSESTEGALARVRSHSALGVPLHPRRGAAEVSGRVPNGERVRVLRYSADRRWLEVESAGARGWIVARYLESTASASPRARPEAAGGSEGSRGSVWSSRAACRSEVAAGNRMEKRSERFRVGSWNVRWFPDGSPNGQERPTDVEWLACAIAWLGVDVLAVQEFKTGRESAAGRRLLESLGSLSGSRWRLVLDDCPLDGRQHVGVLYNTATALVSEVASEASVNPRGGACAGRLRPGLTARVAKAGGGVDFGILVVHLKSGVDDADYRGRRASWGPIIGSLQAQRVAMKDDDQLVLGDWNSMGCPGCRPEQPGDAERSELSRLLSSKQLRLLSAGCSEYYSGKPGALDHVAVSRAFAEADGAELNVAGYCAEARCEALRGAAPAQSALSDHCPVWLDLSSEDID